MAQQLAVVTGASSGIGRATARQLASEGWLVVAVARRAERLEQVAGEVAATGAGRVVPHPLDAADPDAVAAMASDVLARFGTPGAIVNSAGAGVWRWPEDTPPALMEQLLDTPFRAAYHTTHAFLAPMLAAGSGVVVHVGSPASIVAWPSATGYTISRWALRGFHEALIQDLHGTGLHSCHVLFGEVASEYFEVNPDSREHIPRLGRLIPTITPAEAAEVIVRTLHHPRPLVLHPTTMRVEHALHRVAPGLVRTLARRTGRRRER
ncbi:MAG: SDR family NAD(P)-dependent oxidoreductase [Nitriliruptoraceae bacterium]